MSRDELVVYRTCVPVVETEFDPRRGPTVAEAIVEAIASAAEVGPTELPPLYHAVDLDALESLLDADATADSGVYTFNYEVWQVFVSDGHISVCDRRQETEPTPVFEHSAD